MCWISDPCVGSAGALGPAGLSVVSLPLAYRRRFLDYQASIGSGVPVGGRQQRCSDTNPCDLDLLCRPDGHLPASGRELAATATKHLGRNGVSWLLSRPSSRRTG